MGGVVRTVKRRFWRDGSRMSVRFIFSEIRRDL